MAKLPWIQWGKIVLIGLIKDRYFFNTRVVSLQRSVYLTTEDDSTAEMYVVSGSIAMWKQVLIGTICF